MALTVFRELLQNSDDASAKTAEIHFETEAYVKRDKGDGQHNSASYGSSGEKLPDLKTAVVRQHIACVSISPPIATV